MQCDEIAERLAGHVDDPSVLTGTELGHVGSCLRCQAHAVQYRRLRRELASLRADYVIPAPNDLASLLELLRPPAPVVALRRRSRRLAYLGGLAASAAAGAIVVGIHLAKGPRLVADGGRSAVPLGL